MTSTIKVSAALAALTLLGLGGPALAQNAAAPGGVTSGPAAGSPVTLGTGGVTTATPHQTDVTGSHVGAPIGAAQGGQQGGTQSSVRPGQSDAGAGTHQP